MSKITDKQIFNLAIKAGRLKPNEPRTAGQFGLYEGVTIGMVAIRDGLPLEDADNKASIIRDKYYTEWTKGKQKTKSKK